MFGLRRGRSGTSGHTYTGAQRCRVCVCVAPGAFARVLICIFHSPAGRFSPISKGRFGAQAPSPPYGGGGASRRGLRIANYSGGGFNLKASSGAPRSLNPALGHRHPPRVVTRGRDDVAGGFHTVLRDLAVGIPFPAVVVIAGNTRGEPSCKGVGRLAHSWGASGGSDGPGFRELAL